MVLPFELTIYNSLLERFETRKRVHNVLWAAVSAAHISLNTI